MGAFKCRRWLAGVLGTLGFSPDSLVLPEEQLKDLMMVEEAKLEWRIARRYFNEVSEPALIDFAIYNMEAAEKKLVHLIRMLGEKYPDGIWPPEIAASLTQAVDKEREKSSLTEG